MESVIYESKPYFCVGLGTFALFALSGPSVVLGAALSAMGFLILRWRRDYRRAHNVAARRD